MLRELSKKNKSAANCAIHLRIRVIREIRDICGKTNADDAD